MNSRDKIIAVLKPAGSLTTPEIVKRTGLSYNSALLALHRMLRRLMVSHVSPKGGACTTWTFVSSVAVCPKSDRRRRNADDRAAARFRTGVY